MGINIGSFKAVNGGYEGKITTLLHNLTVTFDRVLDRTNETAPAFHLYSGELLIGAAWEKKTKKGARYLSVNLEDPTFSAGFYNRTGFTSDGQAGSVRRSPLNPKPRSGPTSFLLRRRGGGTCGWRTGPYPSD